MAFSVTCVQCGKKFEARRSTAKFCSSICRVNFSRTNHEKGKEVIEKVKKIVEQKDTSREKGYPLTEEEKEMVKQDILDEGALLGAPRKVREKWVADSRVYKPVYRDKEEIAQGRSRIKPYPRSYGAGTGIK